MSTSYVALPYAAQTPLAVVDADLSRLDLALWWSTQHRRLEAGFRPRRAVTKTRFRAAAARLLMNEAAI